MDAFIGDTVKPYISCKLRELEKSFNLLSDKQKWKYIVPLFN